MGCPSWCIRLPNCLKASTQLQVNAHRVFLQTFLSTQVKEGPSGPSCVPDLRLGHKVYRKPTHTDRYLHKTSNHHPQQKRGVIKNTGRPFKSELWSSVSQHWTQPFESALQVNGYSKTEITKAIKPRKQHQTEEEKQPPTNKVFLPYIKGVTDRMGKLLKKHNLQTVVRPTSKI